MAKVRSLEEMAKRYDEKQPIFARRWREITPKVGANRWKESLERLLGAPVHPTFVEAYSKAISMAGDKFEEATRGKGNILVKHYKEKLTGVVA